MPIQVNVCGRNTLALLLWISARCLYSFCLLGTLRLGTRVGLLTVCVPLAFLTVSAHAQPVAMICHLSGRPEVHGHDAGAWMPARLLQKLAMGDQIRCPASSEVGVVMLSGGARFLVGAGKTAAISDSGIAGAAPVAGLHAPSAEAALKLGGSRAGAHLSRPKASEAVDLVPNFDGWLPAASRTFKWNLNLLFQVARGAGRKPPASCTFSLFDSQGYLIWSLHTGGSEAAYPADLPALETETPYVWRLDAFDEAGRPLRDKLPWGIVTLLTEEQAKQLKAETADFDRQMRDHPADPLPRVLLAEKYRQFGVLMFAVKTVGKLPELGEPTDGAEQELYSEAGRLALLLSGNAVPGSNEDLKQ